MAQRGDCGWTIDTNYLALADEDVLEMYKKILLTRMVDERTWILNRMGKVHFHISAQGQEASQIGAAWALRPGQRLGVAVLSGLGRCAFARHDGREIFDDLWPKPTTRTAAVVKCRATGATSELNMFTGGSPVGTQVPKRRASRTPPKCGAMTSSSGRPSAKVRRAKATCTKAMNFAGVHKLAGHLFL